MKIRKRVPIIVAVLILSLGGLGYYLNQDLIPDLKEKKVELAEARLQLVAREAELESVQELEGDFPEIQIRASRALAAVPSEKQIPDVLYKLTRIADDEGMRTNALSVSPASVVSQRSNISSLAFNLSFTGEYADIVRYLEVMEESLRLVNVSNVSISGGGGGEGVDPVLNASLQGQAYFTAEKAATPTRTRR